MLDTCDEGSVFGSSNHSLSLPDLSKLQVWFEVVVLKIETVEVVEESSIFLRVRVSHKLS